MWHVCIFDATLLWANGYCWHITAIAFMTQWRFCLVGTQLGECRYKFLRRWAQYGSHSGAHSWEINQYQTGWIRASAWSFSYIDLLFSIFPPLLFFKSPSANWKEAMTYWASVCLSVFSLIAIYCICSVALVTVHWGDHERKWKPQSFSTFVCNVIHRR